MVYLLVSTYHPRLLLRPHIVDLSALTAMDSLKAAWDQAVGMADVDTILPQRYFSMPAVTKAPRNSILHPPLTLPT